MITDASNNERDHINELAQEHRARAGELGPERVELPGKPYGLAAGDEVIFTGQYRIPGQQRVENGILGTVEHTSRTEDRVTIKTREREPRQVEVDTNEFSDLSLAYAVHVYKAQGLTAEHTAVLTGGWQTDREHTYVAATRARERTDIHVTRDDLGDMDLDAIQRLGELMRRSRAQEASITRDGASHTAERDQEHDTPRPAPSQPDIDLETENRSQRALREHREREHDRSLERDHDIGYGIE